MPEEAILSMVVAVLFLVAGLILGAVVRIDGCVIEFTE